MLCVFCRRGRFSLLAPGARLKGDRAGDSGESAPDVDPELAALMRDIAAGAGSPLAAADDAALAGRLLSSWMLHACGTCLLPTTFSP